MSLDNYTDEQLLMELIRRNGREDAPNKTVRSGQWYESVIGIGEDNAAFIYLDSDDFSALNDATMDD